MPENPNTDKIDEVVVIMHGMYYAMMINADAKENLTVSPDGKVSSDSSALRISDLPVRNIETIRLSSCNTGLLDAINLNDNTGCRLSKSRINENICIHDKMYNVWII